MYNLDRYSGMYGFRFWKIRRKGEKNSFNNKDRDVLYLDYVVDLGSVTYATKDTLVMRDRQVKPEWFEVTYNN